ncbi:alanyl-tRNA synthetase [Thermodesulfobium acidiphilum]|uniref:Alanine--tRNA ligase n=1 Tax=Thermodesulfobium acidiphilum TaxID=1794699 RepID=A0A2R4W2Y4_THEAF|nr:alanine--tRNA ligase [Thermodesulfobium acidiphilum]AWB11078.1 alanyl-tRNA synthetase [Thermodesulfobium acidiphilum]
MTSDDIRRLFLNYFKDRGHTVLPSFSLVPEDPTILFTIAGMVPFKPYFLGREEPPFKRAATSQKCLRTNDIEEVGKTARHHTFFEMLGNFSFGDYFKEKAIPFAWVFVTEVLHLQKERLFITIYKDDDESYEIWRSLDIPAEKIYRSGEKDNFWSAGPVGPCGPCSEIYYDRGENFGCKRSDCSPLCDCDRFLEIWNLVFMQYNRDEESNLTLLSKKGIDTGMGLERIASVLQGKDSNYETDLIYPIIEKISSITGIEYKGKGIIPLRVMSDHLRGAVFAISDGVLPSNEGRGYVVRRLLRRALTLSHLSGYQIPFIYKAVPTVSDIYRHSYPELFEKKEYIIDAIRAEEEKFSQSLKDGLSIFNKLVPQIRKDGIVSGEIAFMLYDTYGFPVELTKEMAAEFNVGVDIEGFNELLIQRKNLSRQGSQFVNEVITTSLTTEFVGYDNFKTGSKILGIYKSNNEVRSLSFGEEGYIVLDKTPFYPESGGQISDIGYIVSKNSTFRVINVQKEKDAIFHFGKVESGSFCAGDSIEAEIDINRRSLSSSNHTCTHILHAVLREKFGEAVSQRGSFVSDELLRFDFFSNALSDEDISDIEISVNKIIMKNYKVTVQEMNLEDAIKSGAIALFSDKYKSKVRVVNIDSVSSELCGGTHVKMTGEIGMFAIVKQESIASSVRRIEAFTGIKALKYFQQKRKNLDEIDKILDASGFPVKKSISIIKDLDETKKRLKEVTMNYLRIRANNLAAEEIGKFSLYSENLNGCTKEDMLFFVDLARNHFDNLILFIYSVNDQGANFVLSISDKVSKGISAKELAKIITNVTGGGSGGRDKVVQGGIKDINKLDFAINALKDFLKTV